MTSTHSRGAVKGSHDAVSPLLSCRPAPATASQRPYVRAQSVPLPRMAATAIQAGAMPQKSASPLRPLDGGLDLRRVAQDQLTGLTPCVAQLCHRTPL